MTYTKIILLAAKKIGVAGTLLLAICKHESHLENVAIMHDGDSPSYGICQVKEATARQLGFKGQAEELMEPKENAKWAAKYLKYQLKRYGNNWCMATAAYNAGTFNESDYFPGKPKNLKYIKCVAKQLPERYKENMECLDTKYAEVEK